MKKSLLLILLFLFQFSISQEKNFIEININALVLDYDSRNGIPFSEVRFRDKNIGVLTNAEGEFSLNYAEKKSNKVIISNKIILSDFNKDGVPEFTFYPTSC